jgi:hypothetical protein
MEWLRSGVPPKPSSPEDAMALVNAADGQCVAPLLHAAIEAEDHDWPDSARQSLRQAYHQTFSNGVVQLELAARSHRLLEEAGLRSLPLKGAAVAEVLYESVAERPMLDVDILALDDWRASVEVLTAAGFREQDRGEHAWSFADPVTGGSLELHHSVCECPGLFPLDPDGIWQRREAGSGQAPVRSSSADLMVQLSLHGAFQHGLVSSLVQWLDLRRLLEAAPPEPELLREVSWLSHSEAAVVATIEAARSIVGCPPLGQELQDALAAGLGEGFRTWLEGRTSDLEGLMARGATGGIRRTRWELARGRRGTLLFRTVVPRTPGAPSWSWARLTQAMRRALWLRHWVADLWRTRRRAQGLES